MHHPGTHDLGLVGRCLLAMGGAGLFLGLATVDFAADSVPTPTTPAPAITTTPVRGGAPAQELHTYTDLDGHTFTGTIQSVVGDNANLLHEDGTSFRVPLASLTVNDQNYLLETVLQQRLAHGEEIITVSGSPTNTDETLTPITGGVTRKWKEAFKVTLENKTSLNFTGLRVQYIIFKTPQEPDVPSKTDLPMELHSLTFPLDTLNHSSTREFVTDQFEMQEIQSRGLIFVNQPNAHRLTDQLDAIWLRVYDSNYFLIREWCSSVEIKKAGNWDRAWIAGGGHALAPAGSRAPGARGGSATARATARGGS